MLALGSAQQVLNLKWSSFILFFAVDSLDVSDGSKFLFSSDFLLTDSVEMMVVGVMGQMRNDLKIALVSSIANVLRLKLHKLFLAEAFVNYQQFKSQDLCRFLSIIFV